MRTDDTTIPGAAVPLTEAPPMSAGASVGASAIAPPVAALFHDHRRVVEAEEETSKKLLLSRDAIYRRTLAAADALAAIAAVSLCRLVLGPNHPTALALLIAPLVVVMGKLMGLYDREEWLVRKSTLDEAPGLFQLATLFAVAMWSAVPRRHAVWHAHTGAICALNRIDDRLVPHRRPHALKKPVCGSHRAARGARGTGLTEAGYRGRVGRLQGFPRAWRANRETPASPNT